VRAKRTMTADARSLHPAVALRYEIRIEALVERHR
jgi:hypothetical protein